VHLTAVAQAKLRELAVRLGKTPTELLELAVVDLAKRTHHNGERWYIEGR
jgi:hypothetical protein